MVQGQLFLPENPKIWGLCGALLPVSCTTPGKSTHTFSLILLICKAQIKIPAPSSTEDLLEDKGINIPILYPHIRIKYFQGGNKARSQVLRGDQLIGCARCMCARGLLGSPGRGWGLNPAQQRALWLSQVVQTRRQRFGVGRRVPHGDHTGCSPLGTPPRVAGGRRVCMR